MEDTGITISGYPLLHDSRNGYMVRTDKHDYYFYELVSVGGTTTSDILMVMVDDWERNQKPDEVPENIGWIYGATAFPDDYYALEDISEYIDKYESTH